MRWCYRTAVPVPVLFLALVLIPAVSGTGTALAGTCMFGQMRENAEVHGFAEIRAGGRTQSDPYERDAAVMETRLQVETATFTDHLDVKCKGDIWADGITDTVEYDTREAWIFTRALGGADLKIGRQVLTWGTGDLVFLNDLFPKDWQSFFIGRDDEYLKAPSDAVKFSFFTNLAGVDLVYTPQFDPDRYITGEYLSHWNGRAGRITGRDRPVNADRPGTWFRDHEIALRVYRTVNTWELALYGYSGFWKTPSGTSQSGRSIFPELSVYGASVRGPAGPGIANLELAWYDSREDRDGDDPNVENSQVRYLAGYTRDLALDFNASLQYYAEQVLHYSAYQAGADRGTARDRFRHVITLQLTRLLMQQTLTLSLSGFWSPSDQDACLKPKMKYQYTDDLIFEVGANIFMGRDTHTFFNQLTHNTNIYAAVRWYF